ncbi:MAG: hypothetical protein KJO07_25040, partial [Deltaproteobacteria bacterium]|nr:hypothetical protein [Deltaproteobacteria bacterium]
RLISDTTGGDGAPETTRSEVALNWIVGQNPAPLCFSQAPDGIYQQVLFGIDKYVVSGNLAAPDNREFRIEDEPPSLNGSYSIVPSVELNAAGQAVITMEIDISDLIRVLDDEKDSIPGETVEIEAGYPDSMFLEELRDSLEDALEGE